MPAALRRTSIVLLLPLLLAACGGGDSPSAPTTPPPPNDPPPTNGGRMIVDDPSFSTVIQEIFQRQGCATGGCHGTAVAQGLDLRPDAAYAALVNVRATQSSSRFLVEPGNAENSWLVIKIENRQTVGRSMPLGGPLLDSIDVGNIRNWIDNGAQNN